MTSYTNLGGRVFASHWHHYWAEGAGAPVSSVATFLHAADLANPFTAQIDSTFPKGMAFADWLVNVGASTTKGQLEIRGAQNTVQAANSPAAQQWIYATSPKSVQYLTFNTPVSKPAAEQCGRFVLSDIHVSSGAGDAPKKPFPEGCVTTNLSPQEKALEFMLFDLSSCIQPDDKPPGPPQPPEPPPPPMSVPPPPPPKPPSPVK
jgi:hypothetical protein